MLPTILSTANFIASPCMDCDLPGYLVLVSHESKNALSQLSTAALAELGPTIARLESAIVQVSGAEHVYVVRFSEGLAAIHFHLFPRTRQLATQWLASAKPPDGNLNGPYIFAWARIRYHVEDTGTLSPSTLKAAEQIRSLLA
jgi:diadenosine tetraphosphate (Ap4A) HIT family hydrolase